MQRFTPTQFDLHTGCADSRHRRERNLQLDLTFIGLDNQITREIKKGLQGTRMKRTGKMSPVYNFVCDCVFITLCVIVCVCVSYHSG